MNRDISINKTERPKNIPPDDEIGFGQIFTDHMFIMDYNKKDGWHDPRIEPYQDLEIDPASSFCHYGQMTFEGLKAYRDKNGNPRLFRPRKNGERMVNSNERMCMPAVDPEFFVEAIKTLVQVDKKWIPEKAGTALYIRPFVLGTETYLGLKPADEYKFIIIASPVGPYYPAGLKPTKILVETEYVRAVQGGTGEAKTAGNYAKSFKAQSRAAEQGYDGVLWLDGREKKYVEEVGAMNVFFKIDDTVVTPELTGTILPGITRDSIIKILQDWGQNIEERKITISEVADAYNNGSLQEAFGTGTAAVVAPIGKLQWNDLALEIDLEEPGGMTQKLYDHLTGIQRGRKEDKFDWTMKV